MKWIPDLDAEIAGEIVRRLTPGWNPDVDPGGLERFVSLFFAANNLGVVRAADLL